MAENNRIYTLLSYAISDSNSFAPNEKLNDELVQICLELCCRDNMCTTLSNYKGSLCSTYPAQLIIPIKQKLDGTSDNSFDKNFVINKDLKDLISKGRFARTRSRFPVPVLLVGDKFVCRSSTLARSPEIYTRTSLQYFTQSETIPQAEGYEINQNGSSSQHSSMESNGYVNKSKAVASNGDKTYLDNDKTNGSKNHKLIQNNENVPEQNKEWLLDKMRKTDIDILHSLKVNVICDLMVENKKVKYGLNVTSSEKIDRLNRYGDFHLLSIPYPGCEFFADYSNNNYKGAGLQFDWKQNFVDAEFQIPKNIAHLQGINWKDYMQWDLVTLTQNYFKLLLRCLTLSDSTGILLHCISGWDRTPLFISLLRLSLWADGLVHQSLNAEEMVYFTLAYDWLLFSHQFSDRINKREEIMHFCFEFLHDISSQEYSLLPILEKDQNLLTESTDDILKTPIEIDSNSTNGHGVLKCIHSTSSEKASKEDHEFEELYSHGEFKDHTTSAVCKEKDDESFLELENVEKCLPCLMENVSCSHSSDRSVSNESPVFDKTSSKPLLECDCALSKSFCKSSAAILPLSVIDNVLPDSISPQHKGFQNHHERSEAPDPANRNMPHQNGFSSSCDTSDEIVPSQNGDSNKNVKSNEGLAKDQIMSDFSVTKSEPIPVPKNCQSRTSEVHPSVDSSRSSSMSNPAPSFEPGGSWQLISTSPPGISAAMDANSSASSTAQSLRNNSFHSSPHTFCSCSSSLNLKLEKRREKLKAAYNLMTPAYNAVVQKQKEQQEQSGFFQSLVHFVKRT